MSQQVEETQTSPTDARLARVARLALLLSFNLVACG